MKKHILFEELANDYLATPSAKLGRPKSHVAHLRLGEMQYAWRGKGIEQIDDDAVADFFRSVRRKGLASATINTYISYYMAVMHYARDERKLITYVPKVKLLHENQRTTFLQKEQIQRLVLALDELRADMVIFAVRTGLRASNVQYLKTEWISADRCVISFPKEVMKNGRPHEVPLFGESKDVIEKRLVMNERLLDRYPWLHSIDYVFAQSQKRNLGKPLSQLTNRSWRRAIERAGLPKGTGFHALRHTFASMHKRAGTNDQIIRKLGGWESMKSMERYSHISSPDLIRAASEIEKQLG